MSLLPHRCPECGAALPADAMRGVCPRCLVRRGLEALPTEADDPRATVHLVLPDDVAVADAPASRELGDYELLAEIGRGGMGVIYQARQKSLGRIVALKLIRAGARARPEDIVRFRTEASAAARLRHPGIVAIHEVGEHEGRHFYSMEFVPGRSLAAALREAPFTPRRAAACVRAVAEAIQSSHSGGVLHRDLKPSNILLDADGRPRVADFGLAKLLQSDSELTVSGAVLGSPNYMPPEQARGKHAEVSTRSDVYALGAILYECLTGRPPFTAATPLETMKLVVEQEPVSPRVLNPALPRDLETITLKCLAKDPVHRYPTAQELADELGRFLADETILARPANALERAGRWARRKPALAALLLVSLAALVAVVTVLALGNARVRREQAVLRKHLYAADTHLAQLALDSDNPPQARRHLRAHVPPDGQPDLRGFEWRWLWRQSGGRHFLTLTGHTAGATCVAFSPDGRRVAAGGAYILRLWDTATWKPVADWKLTTSFIRRLSFSADGHVLAATDNDRNVWVREVESGAELLALKGVAVQGEPAVSALCSPSGTRVIVPTVDAAGTRVVRIFDWSQRENGAAREVFQIPGGAFTEAFLPDGRLLLTVSNVFGAYDLDGRQFTPLPPPGGARFALSPDGRTLAAHDPSETSAAFVRALDGTNRLWLGGRTRTTTADWEVFSPDGRWLVTGGHADGNLRFWNTSTWENVGQHPAVTGIRDAAFSPDGRIIATADLDDSVRLWPGTMEAEAPVFTEAHMPCVLSPSGRHLAFALWHVPTGAAVAELDGIAVGDVAARRLQRTGADPRAVPVFLADDGTTLAVMRRATDGVFHLEQHNVGDGAVGTATVLREFRVVHENVPPPPPALFDAYGTRVHSTNRLAVPGAGVESGKPGGRVTRPPETMRPAWFWRATRDGRRLAFRDHRGAITVWDTASGARLAELPPAENVQEYWFFSPDGEQLCRSFAVEEAFWIEGWQVTEARRCFRERNPFHVQDLAYAPDGRWLAVIDGAARIRFLDAATGREHRSFDGPRYGGDKLAISPDGRTLAVGGSYGVIELIHVTTGRTVAMLTTPESAPHDSIYHGVTPTVARWPRLLAFSPDNASLLAADWGGWVRVWRAPSFAETERE